MTTTLSGKETENSTMNKDKAIVDIYIYRNPIHTHVFEMQTFQKFSRQSEKSTYTLSLWEHSNDNIGTVYVKDEGFLYKKRLQNKENNNKFELYKFSSSKILVT